MEEIGDVDRISDFPEHIIHMVLKSLGTKYAAQTSILSKKWWKFYTYYPDLDFCHEKFAINSYVSNPTQQGFSKQKLEKILEERIGIKNMIDVRLGRFYDQKLRIKQFSLSMAFNDDLPSWLDAWIELAVSCRVETLHLHVVKESRKDTYSSTKDTYSYSLPQVVFALKSLKCLSLRECCLRCPNTIVNIGFGSSLCELGLWCVDIDEKTINGLISNCPLIESLKLQYCVGFKRLRVCGLRLLKQLVYCPKEKAEQLIIEETPRLEKLEYGYVLQSKSFNIGFDFPLRELALSYIDIDEKTIDCLISNCPLIESLKLKYCVGLKRFRVYGLRLLKHLVYCSMEEVEECIIEDTPRLEELEYCCSVRRRSTVAPILHSRCNYLENLVLKGVYIDDKYLSKIISSFRIKYLFLEWCNMPQVLEISSPSLEKIEINYCDSLWEVKLDTPKLCSFIYSGEIMSEFFSEKGSAQWVANIRIPNKTFDPIWFEYLNQYISNMFQVVNIEIFTCKFAFNVEDLIGAPSFPGLCETVNLVFNSSLMRVPHAFRFNAALVDFPTLLDGLLCNIHPRILQLNVPHYTEDGFLKEWEEQVKERREASCCSDYKIKCWRHYLKDVTDVSDEVVNKNPFVKLVVLKLDW